jgi:hypothetical protein
VEQEEASMIDVRLVMALAGIALAGAYPSSVALAGCSESAAGRAHGAQGSPVVVSVTRDASGQLSVVVQGAPSGGVRVEAPPDVKVIAVGGDGAAGTPGASGR